MTAEKNDEAATVPECAGAEGIGAYVRATRKEAGVTLNDLAATCEMPRSTLYRIESGAVSPSLSSLERLAHGLGMELEVRFTR